MQINGILKTALYVANPAVAAAFYRRLFGFATLLESERLVALDVAGKNVLLLFRTGAADEAYDTGNGIIPGRAGGPPAHFAFSMSSEDVEPWRTKLESEGIVVESIVTWPRGAKSISFHDPDGNLAELISPGFWAIS
ncbi:MAG: VOC family protein [Planctomycetaceae bacterium]|nr:VOC family protein [Planctomycetaceae bacterium]